MTTTARTEALPRRLLGAVAVGAALVPLNSTMVAVALPEIGESLRAEAGDLTLWLVTSYLLVNIILQSPAGKLGDMLGRRRSFVMGQGLFATGTLVAVGLPILPALGASRMLMAAGGAMVVPTAMALLRTSIPEARRARAFGYFGALMGASAAVGPVLGGLLTHHLGWKSIFYANWPLLLLSAVLLGRRRSDEGEPRGRDGTGIDVWGTLLLAAGLGGIVIGARTESQSATGIVLGGVGSLIGFLWWQRRAQAPLLPPRLFRSRPFMAGGAIIGMMNLGMYALLFQLPFFFEEIFDLTAEEVGPLLLPMTLAMVFFSPIGGRVVERLGTRVTVSSGVLLGGLGLLSILFGSRALWLPPIVVGLGLVGSAVGMVTGPAQATALSSIPSSQSGVGAGVMSTMRYLGGIAGISIVSVQLASIEPSEILPRNLTCLKAYLVAYGAAFVLAQILPGVRRGAALRQP